MVIYNGNEYSLDELGNLPEGMFRVVTEKTKHYNDSFIPAGPPISKDDLRKTLESKELNPDKAVIIDDFVTNSKFRHLFEGRK